MAPSHTLSERESKRLLAGFGIPIAPDLAVATAPAAGDAADQLGYPVVAKLNGDRIAHKTERGLVRLRLGDRAMVEAAAAELLAAATADDGDVEVLVAPMIAGNRELIAGFLRDPQFGPTVMLGVGGILAEAVGDVVFRPAPLDEVVAADLIGGLATQRLLGPFRGDAAVDRTQLARLLVDLGRLAIERPDVGSVDINPVIVRPDGAVVAVDALVELIDARLAGRRRCHVPRPPATGSAPCSSRAPSSSSAPRATRASSASCRCTTCSPAGSAVRSTART